MHEHHFQWLFFILVLYEPFKHKFFTHFRHHLNIHNLRPKSVLAHFKIYLGNIENNWEKPTHLVFDYYAMPLDTHDEGKILHQKAKEIHMCLVKILFGWITWRRKTCTKKVKQIHMCREKTFWMNVWIA